MWVCVKVVVYLGGVVVELYSFGFLCSFVVCFALVYCGLLLVVVTRVC